MSSYKRRPSPGNTEWFVHDRFGMFIHFGLYSALARHEWIQNREQIHPDEYEKYTEFFNPDLLDAKQWAKKAKAAGMKYAVLTAKHHEGFCLFDTKYTDYKITNTEYGKDIVREYVEAFRAEGLKVGLYYSLIDWHHPEFTIDHNHPLSTHPDAQEISAKRDMTKYAEYMRNQVAELLTNYGKIDILWFDFSYNAREESPRYKPWMQGKRKEAWESEKLIATARALQPEIIIDNRADIEQDLWTPEQVQPDEWVRHKETGELVTWEACQTFSGSWGYYRDEQTWKSPEQLIAMLIKTVSCGGNLLMNVGPTARGCFDSRADNALSVYGEWMRFNSRSIYGCTMAEPEFIAPNGCRLTQTEDGKRLYIHLLEYPFHSLCMPCLAGKVKYAQFLHDASEVKYRSATEEFNSTTTSAFILPPVKPDTLIPVIEVFLK